MDRDACLETAGCGGATGIAELPEGPDLEQPISDTQPIEADLESPAEQEQSDTQAEFAPRPSQIIEALLFSSDTPLNLATTGGTFRHQIDQGRSRGD